VVQQPLAERVEVRDVGRLVNAGGHSVTTCGAVHAPLLHKIVLPAADPGHVGARAADSQQAVWLGWVKPDQK
jgi:hypothetical protein